MDISCILVNWNNADLLRSCLQSVYATIKRHNFTVIVVDNASTDNSRQVVTDEFPEVTLITNQRNMGFARAVNKGLQQAQGRYCVLLNTDAILTENALDRLIGFMDEQPDVGVCGGQLVYEDGRKQHSFDNFPSLLSELTNKSLLRRLFPRMYPGKYQYYNEPLLVDSIIGACFVIRKSCIDRIGMLDEDYFFFLEETDLCFRMKQAGHEVMHVPDAQIVHLQGQSAKKVPVASRVEYYYSRYLFFRKNRSKLSFVILMLAIFIKCMVKSVIYGICAAATGFRNESINHKLRLALTLVKAHLTRFDASLRMEGQV